MFVLLNLAMGGNLGGNIDPSLNLATMEVDYVAHCSSTNTNQEVNCDENTPLAGDGSPPTITSTNPDTTAVEEEQYSYTIVATDPDDIKHLVYIINPVADQQLNLVGGVEVVIISY